MDWDTHRYRECYFAVPMMGEVLHTVNVRLSPEQILYTINHAEDDVMLINSKFLSILHTVSGDSISSPVHQLVYYHAERQSTAKPSWTLVPFGKTLVFRASVICCPKSRRTGGGIRNSSQ